MTHPRLWPIGGRPIVLAHRGGGHEVPENSIYAFHTMHEQGFRYIETDVHATRDGHVVVFHDPILDRVTDAHGKISHYSWADLRQVRDRSGNPIMRLDDVLAEFPDLIFNIDAKHGAVVSPLAACIRRHNAEKRVSLASFSERRLRRLRRLLPGVRSSLGTGAVTRLVLAAQRGTPSRILLGQLPASSGVEAVQVPQRAGRIQVVTPQFISLSHQLGYAVHVWTINDSDEIRKLVGWGVDGIVTDEPSLARRIIEQEFDWQ
ncbi:glycerophosphodiester phosphodiesterase [Trueperella sp. LYQ143]|uniref:glycerophosphodiester phosphodiesterase n=1 Tax=unclassified Trueperella TaxID=2630174 RepID=UPI0039835F8B